MTAVRLDKEDFEDIRFAVVMNGGVSLAIWIGGVSLEINRLTNAQAGGGAVYDQLLDLVQATARVDVIAGTSAGGINGAFLALAAVYGQDLAPLGDLWARRGGLDELLRSPMEKDPPSLMRGDEYFLRYLADAFREVFPNDPGVVYRAPGSAPVDLTMTTSILAGEPRVFVDDYGTRIVEVDHGGRFRFFRTATTSESDDPFREEAIASQLALASRSTASFPFAFEASYCPVGEVRDVLHPDMAAFVNFSGSRYVVDGGVLLNKPIGPALEAIRAQPADRQVRRVLLYVNPDPGDAALTGALDTEGPKLTSVVVDSLFTLPRSQSISVELKDLQQRNRRARDRRESRLELIQYLGEGTENLARDMYDTYRAMRRRRATSVIADIVANESGTSLLTGGAGPVSDAATLRPTWTREDVVAAVDSVVRLPFVPPSSFDDATSSAPNTWSWGIAVVERLGYVAVDVLRRAMWIAPMPSADEPSPVRTSLRGLRAKLHAQLEALRQLRMDDAAFWRGQAAKMPPPPANTSERPSALKEWAEQARQTWAKGVGASQAGAIAAAIAALLVQAKQAAATLPPEQRTWAQPDRILLDDLLSSLVPTEEADACLQRLLATEVVMLVLAGAPDEVDQAVDLMQISGNGANSFGGPEVASKLAGVQLGHFGAFYKESWRVNDWIWGRIDGASRLVQATLSPARLRQLKYGTQEALDRIRALATGGPDGSYLAAEFEQQRCLDELRYLDDDTFPMPPSLPVCSMAVARRIHLETLRSQLSTLALAVESDIRQGAATPSLGERFRAAYHARVTQHPGGLPAAQVFALFRGAELGRETVQDDAGSVLYARTVSTAAAVTGSTLASGKAGPAALRQLGRAVRGVTMLLYTMVLGTARGGSSAAAVTITLGVGGACLALFLLTRAVPPVVPLVGFVILLAGLALASLRLKLRRQAGYLILGLVGTVAAGILLAWWIPQVSDTWRPFFRNGLVLLGVIAMVLGFMGLGGVYDRPPGDDPEASNNQPGPAGL